MQRCVWLECTIYMIYKPHHQMLKDIVPEVKQAVDREHRGEQPYRGFRGRGRGGAGGFAARGLSAAGLTKGGHRGNGDVNRGDSNAAS